MAASSPPSDCHYTQLPDKDAVVMGISAAEALQARVRERARVVEVLMCAVVLFAIVPSAAAVVLLSLA
jgi:hypothetical protein